MTQRVWHRHREPAPPRPPRRRYNAIDGVPSCASRELLTGLLRDEWRCGAADGGRCLVMSDYNAIEFITDAHHYMPTYVEGVAAASNAGCDTMSNGAALNLTASLHDALAGGIVAEATVTEVRVRRGGSGGRGALARISWSETTMACRCPRNVDHYSGATMARGFRTPLTKRTFLVFTALACALSLRTPARSPARARPLRRLVVVALPSPPLSRNRFGGSPSHPLRPRCRRSLRRVGDAARAAPRARRLL